MYLSLEICQGFGFLASALVQQLRKLIGRSDKAPLWHPCENAAIALMRQAILRQSRVAVEAELIELQLEVEIFEALVGDKDLSRRLRQACEKACQSARNERNYEVTRYHTLTSML